MSPQAGFVLIEEIAPRLRSAIPSSVKPVGAEDHEELIQDGICMAAQLLHNLELKGKKVTPGNVAYYTILHLKSGRRSHSAARSDVMGSGTQLDHRSSVLSFEEPAGVDPETMEEIPLGELLSGNHEDPSTSASRIVDWDDFLQSHDPQYRSLVKNLGEGKMIRETGLKYGKAQELKKRLAADLLEYMGDQIIADSVHVPFWRGNIIAEHEKAACRADRRHR